MNFKLIFNGLILCSLAPAALAIDVDTFETYADEAALDAKWIGSGGNGLENPQLVTSGGAASTNNYMKLTDTGYTAIFTGSNLMTPPNTGAYKLSFYYKNGIDGIFPLEDLKFTLSQDSTTILAGQLSPALAPPVSPDWILYESGPIALTNASPITVAFNAYSDEQLESNYACGIDQIILTEIVGSPPVVSVSPASQVYLSRTRTITANVSLGSGTYNQVTFDVGNNGSVEFTDTTAPYEFSWNTLSAMPQDTSGPVTLKVTATDSNLISGSATVTYTVDNQYNGRELLVDSNMDNYQGTGFGANLPVGWVEFQPTANATYGPGLDRTNAADKALEIKYTAGDFSNRYTLRAIGKQGRYKDLQATWWGKGTSCRMYYCTSPDGVTYANQAQDAGVVNNANWIYVVESPVQQMGLTATDYITIAPHQFNAGSHFYDDVKLEGMLVPVTSDVDGWKLY